MSKTKKQLQDDYTELIQDYDALYELYRRSLSELREVRAAYKSEVNKMRHAIEQSQSIVNELCDMMSAAGIEIKTASEEPFH